MSEEIKEMLEWLKKCKVNLSIAQGQCADIIRGTAPNNVDYAKDIYSMLDCQIEILSGYLKGCGV